jgi:hypothetical protein
MKKILKSLLVLGLVATTLGGTTMAWFTSTVDVDASEISTGYLEMVVDSTDEHVSVGSEASYGDVAFKVGSYYQDGSLMSGDPLESWTIAEPGEYVAYTNEAGEDTYDAGNYSYWLAVRNIHKNGTGLPMKFRAIVDRGEWTAMPYDRADLDGDGDTDCSLSSADPDLVQVVNFHRYATGACEGHDECENLYYALENAGFNHADGLTADNDGQGRPLGSAGNYFYGTTHDVDSGWPAKSYANTNPLILEDSEFVIYRVDLNLSESADQCYQGATYEFDFLVEAAQDEMDW